MYFLMHLALIFLSFAAAAPVTNHQDTTNDACQFAQQELKKGLEHVDARFHLQYEEAVKIMNWACKKGFTDEKLLNQIYTDAKSLLQVTNNAERSATASSLEQASHKLYLDSVTLADRHAKFPSS